MGECLATRNIPSALECKRCNQTESITHLLLHCDFAQQVWKLTPFINCTDTRGLVDLDSVWPALCGLLCLPPTGVVAGPLVPWILWSLWIARNKLTFDNKSRSPEDVIPSAISTAREWLNEQMRDSATQKTSQASDNSKTIVYIEIRCGLERLYAISRYGLDN